MSPIAALIKNRLTELGLSRRALIDRCGYKNVAKGLRRLDSLLAGNLIPTADLITRLPAALELPVAVITEAIKATREALGARREALERASFVPHAILLTERSRPSSITMAAFTGMVRQLRVDFEPGSEPYTFINQTQTAIKHRQDRFGGYIPFFGPAVGFVINYEINLSVIHDLTGNITKVEKWMKRQPVMTLELVGGGSVLTVLKLAGS